MNQKDENFNRRINTYDHYLLSYCRLFSAIRHYDDTTDLDKRSYHFTLRTQNDEFEQLHRVIYFRILSAAGLKSYAAGLSRPALILDQDWAGSRENKPVSEYPHFHGLLIFPQDFGEVHRHNGSDLDLIRDNLKSTYTKSAFGRTSHGIKVDVRRYEMDDCLGAMVDYNSKFQRKIDKPGQKNSPEFSPGLNASGWEFPWDFDKQKTRRSKISTLEKNFGDLCARFESDPHQFFSERYVHKFGDRLSTIARVRTH